MGGLEWLSCGYEGEEEHYNSSFGRRGGRQKVQVAKYSPFWRYGDSQRKPRDMVTCARICSAVHIELQQWQSPLQSATSQCRLFHWYHPPARRRRARRVTAPKDVYRDGSRQSINDGPASTCTTCNPEHVSNSTLGAYPATTIHQNRKHLNIRYTPHVQTTRRPSVEPR